MKLKNRLIGGIGEIVAAAAYLVRGYRLLSWRKRFGRLEADLIVRRGSEVILVEVKSGFGGFWEPERYFNEEKLRNLRKVAASLVRRETGPVSLELFVFRFGWCPRARRYRQVCLW